MKDVVAIIAKQITKYRTQAGLTKKELSQVLGVAPSTVSGWENGEYAPSADTLVRISGFFQISLDEIYGIENAYRIKKDPVLTESFSEMQKSATKLFNELSPEKQDQARAYLEFLLHEQSKENT